MHQLTVSPLAATIKPSALRKGLGSTSAMARPRLGFSAMNKRIIKITVFLYSILL
jgi:hypothetical protein